MSPRPLVVALVALSLVGAGCLGFGGDDAAETNETNASDTDPGPSEPINEEETNPDASDADASEPFYDGPTTCEVDSSTDHTVTRDGVSLAITVHKPSISDNTTVPLILHSHGWSGTRAQEATGLVGQLVETCYGVLSIDMRGHGESGGEAHVHNPDVEIKDVQAILDWATRNLTWLMEDPEPQTSDDIMLGAIGGSYGGGYQLLTAAFDDRVDAIAPEITWNDLPWALGPNGAVKSAWVDLLYFGAQASGTAVAPFIDEGFLYAMATNEFPNGDMPGEPDVVTSFTESSPASYPSQIDVPTLLIQGVPDTLFNLNQAVWNFQQIANATNAEVNLVTHLGGHIINSEGTIPGGAPAATGLQPPVGPSPCGDTDQKVVDWYDEHLRRLDDDSSATVELALDDGETCLKDTRTAAHVLGFLPGTSVDLDGPVAVTQGAPVPSGFLQVDQEASAGSPVQVEVLTASGNGSITGIPVLEGTATVAGGDAIAYFAIATGTQTDNQVVNSQVIPMRWSGPDTGSSFRMELGGIGASLEEGESVFLHVSSLNTQYAHNSERLPGSLVLEDLTLTLPLQGADAS